MGERKFLMFLALLSSVESLRIASSSCADPTSEISLSPTGVATVIWLLGRRFIKICHPKPPEGTLPEGPSDALQPFLDNVEELGELWLRLKLYVLHYVAQGVGWSDLRIAGGEP